MRETGFNRFLLCYIALVGHERVVGRRKRRAQVLLFQKEQKMLPSNNKNDTQLLWDFDMRKTITVQSN